MKFLLNRKTNINKLKEKLLNLIDFEVSDVSTEMEKAIVIEDGVDNTIDLNIYISADITVTEAVKSSFDIIAYYYL